ncbi:hypothetical protein Acr_23g0006440 [Actinidia rufa]|uniref:Reverse transcriptase domain-containing protein n=1 Tax=Actinidia rufa TaxID=165716 RepID=A0A7J0GN88_9ERIC|nr:hypothetical protein Acr_23g0006440 [Actinidia rufa]
MKPTRAAVQTGILQTQQNANGEMDEKCNGLPVTPYDIGDFQHCCNKLGIMDTYFSGAYLTWTNNSTWCKLDRAMINNKWVGEGLRVHAHFGFPGKLSDHSPCVVSLFGDNTQGAKPFKFFNMLCRKLKLLKEPLKVLNKKHFSHISSRPAAAETSLYDMQQKLHDNPMDIQLQERMAELKSYAFRLAEAERSYCSQLAKSKYLKESDKGTKFFHDLIKSNRNKNQIISLTLPNGSRTSSYQEVSNAFIDFYKELLGTSYTSAHIDRDILSDGKLVDEAQANALTHAVSDEEITEALFSIGNDKAPGPDGFSSYFFKMAWNIVGGDFCDAVKEFFSSGQILRQMNHSVIALVPKSNNASNVEDYRPIACCNVSYKVISKILASRLSPILTQLIDPAQAAFIQSRSMVENIYLVQELLKRYGWSRISPRCIMKIDLRKAYDTINWGFVKEVLMGMGFPRLFVGWIMQCISTTSYSISINGSFHGFFKGQQGYINAWAGMTLSYAGRCELIKSVLQGVECFWLASLPIPVGNIHAKSDTLWVKWIHQNYLQDSNIWDYSGNKQESKLMKQLLVIRDKIRAMEGSTHAAISRLEQWAIDGKFSSKSAYEFFRPRKIKLTWPKLVWQTSIIPKHSFILWLGLKDRLLTRDKLQGYIEDQTCPLCGEMEETIDHLFFQCRVGRQEARGTGAQAKAKRIGLACTVYYLWEARNERIFEGKIKHPRAIIRCIQIQAYRVLYNIFPSLNGV